MMEKLIFALLVTKPAIEYRNQRSIKFYALTALAIALVSFSLTVNPYLRSGGDRIPPVQTTRTLN